MAAPLFETLTSSRIGHLCFGAEQGVYYAAPGIQDEPADALCALAKSLGADLIQVFIDFDERVFRMGYGSFEAVKALQEAGIAVRSSPGLRTGLLVVDGEGYIFTPTALYLEADERPDGALNAMRMTPDQVREALSRLSPAAKAVAVAMATSPEKKAEIEATAVEVASELVEPELIKEVTQRLEMAPIVKFDLARQVRVYSSYLQYVELKLTGASIERRRITIPAGIQKLVGAKDLEGRLRTTFDLIAKDTELSAKQLVDRLNALRADFTRSLGKDHGRVVLKSAKPLLDERLEELRADLEEHQNSTKAGLQTQLDNSKAAIVDLYKQVVIDNPPDAVRGLGGSDPEKSAQSWLNSQLDRVFPSSDVLVGKMSLGSQYKDITFGTLNDPEFVEMVKEAFPDNDWDKVHEEFQAAGQSGSTGGGSV